jgi:hypothetical protein
VLATGRDAKDDAGTGVSMSALAIDTGPPDASLLVAVRSTE